MTLHRYFVPIIGSGVGGPEEFRRPKYSDDLVAAGLSWKSAHYGAHPWAILVCDVDDATDAALRAHPDLRAIPDNLNQPIGAGARDALANALEAMRIPAEWLDGAHTWRQALRRIMVVFNLANRFQGLFSNAELIPSAAALDLRMNQLSAANRNRLAQAITNLGFDTTGITATTTVRQALKALSDQWQANPPEPHNVAGDEL